MKTRLRNLRQSPGMRKLVRETSSRGDFVMPYFVRAGKGVRQPISSMPGQFRSRSTNGQGSPRSREDGRGVADPLRDPASRNAKATGVGEERIVQQAVRALKDASPTWWSSPTSACANYGPCTAES